VGVRGGKGLFTSAIMGAHEAVAGSLPQGSSSSSCSGLSATGSRSRSMPIFGSGIAGMSASEPVMIVIPSRSSGLLEVGTRSWYWNGLCGSMGDGRAGLTSLANETVRGFGDR
jgi:hypothetical protein